MLKKELKELMAQMTLEEKVGQLVQLDGGCFGGPEVMTGPAAKIGVTQDQIDCAGSVINVLGADKVRDLQDRYLRRSRLKVPLLFMDDVLYGYRTAYPAPIGMGCTWEPEALRDCYANIAEDAAADGCMVTFGPAVDVVRDARWGRVVEMPGGEDPYLGSAFAQSMVSGLQEGLGEGRGVASCVKHFGGYGAVEAGREYNTVDMSERRLRQEYLPPYRAAVDAGARMVMTSFNTVDGVPATGNRWLMHDVLRDEWGFDGTVITDYAAILELVNHGVAADTRDAARLAMDASVDIDMKTNCYAGNLADLVRCGEVPEDAVDAACWRVLSLKNELGLFENPYYQTDAARAAELAALPERVASEREVAVKSLVLLENKGVLPLAAGEGAPKVALIGPYADSTDIVGLWAMFAERSRVKTVYDALCARYAKGTVRIAKGCEILSDEERKTLGSFGGRQSGKEDSSPTSEELEAEALAIAAESDVCVLCLGEHPMQSGEAGSRTDITLPRPQQDLLRKVHALGKKVVVVVFSGRPLALEDVLPYADALLMAWWPGTAGGLAVADVLTGAANPSGRLTMTFPVSVGQCPLYYAQLSTGRPKGKNHAGRFVTGWLDAPNDGVYPFGYGLSYHSATLSDLTLSDDVMTADGSITVSVCITNDGSIAGTETVQLYLRDIVGSVARPIKELKAFKKVTLEPGESRTVQFEIREESLRFWRRDMSFGSEPGEFAVMVGLNSRDVLEERFSLV